MQVQSLKSALNPIQIRPKGARNLLAPISNAQKQRFDQSASFIEEQQNTINPREFAFQDVPIFKMRSIKHELLMHPPLEPSSKNDDKDKKVYKENLVAKGRLFGNYNASFDYEDQDIDVELIGNFSGVFQGRYQSEPQKEDRSISHESQLQNMNKTLKIKDGSYIYYFQGSINSLKILKIKPKDEEAFMFDQEKNKDLTQFKGHFKGIFVNKDYLRSTADEQKLKGAVTTQKRIEIDKSLFTVKENKKETQYFVPAFVRFDIREVTQINLEQASAKLAAVIVIDIKLNPEIALILTEGWKQKPPRTQKLSIDFNRNRPLILPFYEPDNQMFPQTDEETEYQWDDLLGDFNVEVEWIEEDQRMKYVIRSQFNSFIDNTHGVFYAPFNLNILRFVLTFHSIKLSKHCKLNIVCCDLQDYDQQKYTPFTPFNQLPINHSQSHRFDKFQKQIDRLTKISFGRFRDQGEYSIASNRFFLFPYYKRTYFNTNELGSDIGWALGAASRSKLLEKPAILSLQQSYETAKMSGTPCMFKMQQWQYLHVQIPIYKYGVIDLINIFVPILILSVISLLLFNQENGKNADGNISLAKRIGSGAGLLLAYVQLTSIIRQRLPPCPSITFLEIIIYASTIPNILAIIASAIEHSLIVSQFFITYKPFTDPLFVVSFSITIVSVLTLAISLIVYYFKQYKSDFTFYAYSFSKMNRVRAPLYMQYMHEMMQKRKQKILTKIIVQYSV